MTPRPFHRWKSFWLGLLGLAFLGWAWASSLSHAEGVIFLGSGYYTEFCQTSGTLILNITPGPITSHIDWFRDPADPVNEPLFPAPFSWEQAHDGYLFASLAHWFLILLFLIPWAAFLLWRGRRLIRLAAAAGEPQA